MTAPDVMAKELLTATTTASLRPGFEGNNISYAIGFKHISYLVEAGVIEHFRRAGLPPGKLFQVYGVCLEVVRLGARLGALLHVDDLAEVEVRPVVRDTDDTIRFKVGVFVERDGARTSVASASAEVVLRAAADTGSVPVSGRPEDAPGRPEEAPGRPEEAPRLPDELARFVKPRIGDGPARPVAEPVLADLIGATNAFGWTWRLPYFYCHFNERVQMTGFLRLMEEVVDLFLADRGLPIKRVLDEKGLIPVVTRSEITLLDEVRMEEQVHTVYTVEGIFKDLLYTSRMDCYVVRDGRAVLAATGTITHGYLHEERPNEWTMATFDDEVRTALEGRRP